MRILFQSANQLKYREEMLWLGTTTLATVIIWIIYAVYVAYNTPVVDEQVQNLLKPLNPNLNATTLQGLTQRYTPQEPYTIIVQPGTSPIRSTTSTTSSESTNPAATTDTQEVTPLDETTPTSNDDSL
jgi:hypothetical protein